MWEIQNFSLLFWPFKIGDTGAALPSPSTQALKMENRCLVLSVLSQPLLPRTWSHPASQMHCRCCLLAGREEGLKGAVNWIESTEYLITDCSSIHSDVPRGVTPPNLLAIQALLRPSVSFNNNSGECFIVACPRGGCPTDLLPAPGCTAPWTS